MDFNEGMKSTGNIVQATPQNFFNWLNGIFRFDLDVCALPENAKCEKYYTPVDDGLSQKWSGGGMVQSSVWKGNHQLGQESLRGDSERLLQVCCHAASSKNRHKVVPELCVRKSFSVLCGRTAFIR